MTDGLTVKRRSIKDGAIAEPVTIPANVTKPASVTFTLVVHDARGNHTQAVGTLIIQPTMVYLATEQRHLRIVAAMVASAWQAGLKAPADVTHQYLTSRMVRGDCV
jgi:hypothetical protein